MVLVFGRQSDNNNNTLFAKKLYVELVNVRKLAQRHMHYVILLLILTIFFMFSLFFYRLTKMYFDVS